MSDDQNSNNPGGAADANPAATMAMSSLPDDHPLAAALRAQTNQGAVPGDQGVASAAGAAATHPAGHPGAPPPQAGFAAAPQAGYAAPQAQAGYAAAPQAQAGYAAAPQAQAGYAAAPQAHAGYAAAPQAQAGYAAAPQAQAGYAAPPQAGGYAAAPQAGGYAGGAPPTNPPAGGASTAGSGLSKNAMIGLGVGGGLLVAGLGIGLALAMGGGGSLPLEYAQLPDDVRYVSQWDSTRSAAARAGIEQGDVPDEAYWSELAEDLCGGKDVFATLMRAPMKSGRKSAARLLALDPHELQMSLKCGKKMAEEIDPGSRHWVVFSDGKDRRQVLLIPGGPDKLPSTTDHFKTASDPSHFVDTHCLVPWDKDLSDKCADNARAAARLDKTDVWVRGDMQSLEAFGDEYDSSPGDASSEMDRIRELTSELSDFTSVTVGNAEHYTNRYPSSMGAGVWTYDKKEQKELISEIEDGGRVWGLGVSTTHTTRKMKLVIVASNESSAGDIKELLDDYHSLLKDEIDAREEKEEDAERDEDEQEKYLDYNEVRRHIAWRALRKAKVTRDGKRIVMLAEGEATDREVKKIERFLKWRKKHVPLVQKIVASLLKGDEPKESTLSKLGGDDFLDEWETAKDAAE